MQRHLHLGTPLQPDIAALLRQHRRTGLQLRLRPREEPEIITTSVHQRLIHLTWPVSLCGAVLAPPKYRVEPCLLQLRGSVDMDDTPGSLFQSNWSLSK